MYLELEFPGDFYTIRNMKISNIAWAKKVYFSKELWIGLYLAKRFRDARIIIIYGNHVVFMIVLHLWTTSLNANDSQFLKFNVFVCYFDAF